MRYSKFALPLVMSVLVSLTSITAVQASAQNLGRLGQHNSWKIGTVNAKDNKTYCAMVNKFDEDTILAFSKDKEGNESIAIDLMKGILVPGVDYGFVLHAGRTRRSVTGKANSEKSVVLDVKDEAIFSELEKGEKLRVSSTPFEATFEIRKFLASYAVLLDCAGSLKDGNGPLVRSIPVNKVERLKDDVVSPRYNSLKEEFEAELKEQLLYSKDKVAILTQQQEELKSQLEDQKDKVKTLQIKQDDHKTAQAEMIKAIAEKDDEIDRLLSKQKANNALIKKLTLERNKVARAELSAESKQKGFMKLLADQKEKVANFERKYKTQERVKENLKSLLEEKTKEARRVNKNQLAENKEIIRELTVKYNKKEKANRKLKKSLDQKEFEVARSSKKYSSKSRKIIKDLEKRYKEEEKARRQLKIKLEDKELEIEELTRRQSMENSDLVRDLESQEKELNAEIKKLRNKNVRLEGNIVDVRKDLRIAEDMLFKSQRGDKADALKQHKERITSLEKRYEEQEIVKQELQGLLEVKEDEITRIRKQNLSINDTKLRDLRKRENKLADRVEGLEYENKKLSDEINKARKSFKEAVGYEAKEAESGFYKIIEVQKEKLVDLEGRFEKQRSLQKNLQEKLEDKEKQIVDLKSFSISNKNKLVDDMVFRERKLSRNMRDLEDDNNRLQSEIELARKALYDAGFADKTDGKVDFSSVIQQQLRKSAVVAKSFSDAKTIYEDKLADLEAERDDFKAKLELLSLEKATFEVEAESAGRHASLSKKQVSEIKNRMISMAQQRENISKSLKAQRDHNKILEAALEAKAQELKAIKVSSGGDTDRLLSVQAELAQFKREKNIFVEKLQDELKDKTTKYDVLKTQFDKRLGFMAVDKKVLTEIDLKEETLIHVEKQIKDTEDRKYQLIAELEKYRKDIINKRSNFISDNETKHRNAKANIDSLTADKEKLQKELPRAHREFRDLREALGEVIKEDAPLNLIGGSKRSNSAQSFVKNKLSNLEIQLASAGQQKQELSDLVDKKRKEGEEKIKLLEIRQDSLVSMPSLTIQQKVDLEKIKLNLRKMNRDQEISMTVLNGKLKDKNAEYEALEKEFDKQSNILPKANKIERELVLVKGNIKKMEARLIKTSEGLKKAIARGKVASKDLPVEKIAILKDLEYKIKENERLIKKIAIDHEAYLNKREFIKEEIADLQVEFDENIAKTAPLKVRKKLLEKDLSEARKLIATLEFEVDEADKKQQALADKVEAQNEIVKTLQVEIAESSKVIPMNFKKTVRINVQKEEIDRLERDLAVVRTQYKLAMDEVAVAQDKIAEVSQEKSIDSQGYKQQHFAIQAEVYELKKKLTEIETDMAPLELEKNRSQAELEVTKARLSELEGQLIGIAQEKQSLSISLEEQIHQNHSLQDALAANEQEIFDLKYALDESNRRLAETQDNLDTLKPEYSTVVNDLVLQLKSKITQYDDLQNMFDAQMKTMPVLVDVEAELESNKNGLESLEMELIKVNAERRRAEEEAIRSKAELEKSLLQIDALKGNLSSHSDKSRKMREIANNRRRLLETAADKEVLESTRLNMEKRQRSDELERKKRASSVHFNSTREKERVKPRVTSKAAKKTISKAEGFLNRMMAKHRTGMEGKPVTTSVSSRYSPKKAPREKYMSRINGRVSLNDLLNKTGAYINNFATIEQNSKSVVSQWNAGRMSGMYEQIGSTGGFQEQVDNYINRYRADCSDGLKVRITPSMNTNAGDVATADLECNMAGNSYANSIIFVDNDSGFSSIVHTSYPEEKASVRNVRDSILRTLERSKGFSAPRVIKEVETTEYKFNITEAADAEEAGDTIETLVIQ